MRNFLNMMSLVDFEPNSDRKFVAVKMTETKYLMNTGDIEHVVNKGMVIDDGDEIFNEYRGQLAMQGQPGIGDIFMKWVHDNSWNPDKVKRVSITPSNSSYEEFPEHDGLVDFDNSDRKFVAVANAHPDKPPILQATDS